MDETDALWLQAKKSFQIREEAWEVMLEAAAKAKRDWPKRPLIERAWLRTKWALQGLLRGK